MADGAEERKERELRRQEESSETRHDRLDRDATEEWEPERRDS